MSRFAATRSSIRISTPCSPLHFLCVVTVGCLPLLLVPRPPSRWPASSRAFSQEWFAWLEENLDLGADSTELLRILVEKGFTPSKNKRLMQFVAAHDSLTVTTTVPVRGADGRIVSMPTTATIVGSLVQSDPLPPQWTAWLRDNIARGVDRGLLLELLIKHGFQPERNPLLTQALTESIEEPTHFSRVKLRQLTAQQNEAALKKQREAAEAAAKKDRALDFASERTIVGAVSPLNSLLAIPPRRNSPRSSSLSWWTVYTEEMRTPAANYSNCTSWCLCNDLSLLMLTTRFRDMTSL